MNRDELLAMVVKELATVLPLEGRPVQESDLLQELPSIDSLRLVRIASALERSAGAEFDDEALFSARTVGDLVDSLAAALRAAA
ncbi:acyl carrier protein [Streptomyces sp. NPDC047009]|uniref:acyl carrier protein n=1 Tax=Streptomyces sp. NPDC047009 TaxID=3154496 RepID=UPI003402B10B